MRYCGGCTEAPSPWNVDVPVVNSAESDKIRTLREEVRKIRAQVAKPQQKKD